MLAGVLALAGIKLVGIPEADVVAALRWPPLGRGVRRTPWLVAREASPQRARAVYRRIGSSLQHL
jgi:hypothetical protein